MRIVEVHRAIREERRDKKEPQRIKYAKEQLEKLGYAVSWNEQQRCLSFMHKGRKIKFHPFSGWASGKTIKDGRGIANLLKQLGDNHEQN